MTRHLKSCVPAKGEKDSSAGGKSSRDKNLLQLAVDSKYGPEYWMHLEVRADSRLHDLDKFLRDIWLECCGHLSAFRIEGESYSVSPMDESWSREMNMNSRLGQILYPGLKFSYEYDFGSTTELALKVVSERIGRSEGGKVRLLARNEPPKILCDRCGKPATQVCAFCIYSEEAWLCDDCLEKHQCGDEGFLPVVNSPRVGVCGYSGEEY
jgi:hypothetical protein